MARHPDEIRAAERKLAVNERRDRQKADAAAAEAERTAQREGDSARLKAIEEKIDRLGKALVKGWTA